MILALLLLIAINGVLAMTELAVVSARKARLQGPASAGDPAARAALELIAAPSRFLASVQIGITLVGVLAGAVGQAGLAAPLARWLGGIEWLAAQANAIATGLVVAAITYLSLVFGELVPKRLAMHRPERIARLMARPMRLIARLSAPLVTLLSVSTDTVTRLLGVKPGGDEPVSEDEIKALAEQGVRSGVLKAAESDILRRVFRLDDRAVAHLMTPRHDVIWLDLNLDRERLRSTLLDHSYSYYPVADGALDRVVGVVKAKEALADPEGPTADTLRACLRDPLMVPAGHTALELLDQFRKDQVRVALVLDEYGGVSGMITLHDVIEVIVGDLPDLEDGDAPRIVPRGSNSWLVDGRLPTEDLKTLLGAASLPDEQHYHTAAGFVIHVVRQVPDAGQVFEWGRFRFEIVDLDGQRVDQILVTRLDPEPDESEE